MSTYSRAHHRLLYISIYMQLDTVYSRRSQLTMNQLVYWLCVAVLLSCNVLVQSEITTLYPTDPEDWSLFPYGAGDIELEDDDDMNYWVPRLTQNITFYGTTYDLIQVGRRFSRK